MPVDVMFEATIMYLDGAHVVAHPLVPCALWSQGCVEVCCWYEVVMARSGRIFEHVHHGVELLLASS